MANIFTTAFVINGMLSNSFTSSTKMANSQLTELQQTVKRIDLAQKKLNAEFTNGAMSVEQYERKWVDIKIRLINSATTRSCYRID